MNTDLSNNRWQRSAAWRNSVGTELNCQSAPAYIAAFCVSWERRNARISARTADAVGARARVLSKMAGAFGGLSRSTRWSMIVACARECHAMAVMSFWRQHPVHHFARPAKYKLRGWWTEVTEPRPPSAWAILRAGDQVIGSLQSLVIGRT